ncbi:uncharacterized protein LOC129591563 [Paramacrobiotus metropolitanus]|uniref:uncharacterized protein LOC129591563 n=1 Tax=Paramacrobiotus metropolitanus TaxID=2943436 RepID=UPI0024465922|nr:uncharacterized protein LOC129591563 [Paramacrobiotus metropolitanus]
MQLSETFLYAWLLSAKNAFIAAASVCNIKRSLVVFSIVLAVFVILYIKYASELNTNLSSSQLQPAVRDEQVPKGSGDEKSSVVINAMAMDPKIAAGNSATASNTSVAAGKLASSVLATSTDSRPCQAGTPHTVRNPCQRCSKFEASSGMESCQPTGYKEQVECRLAGTGESEKPARFWRSCKPDTSQQTESQKFTIFTALSFICAILFSGVTLWRHHMLQKQNVLRIQQRIQS